MASNSKLPQLRTAIDQAASRQVFRILNAVRNEAIGLILRGSKSGRVYGRHQASAPGEAPASDTGRLVQSIRVDFQPNALAGRVVAGTDYAKKLEFGTVKIAPRPFMTPAVNNVKQAGLAKGFEIKV
jgi:HK97 gp10 family phage protein